MKTTDPTDFNRGAGEASSGDAAFRADGLESIRGWLRSYVDDGRLPGAAVLIARNGRIALFQGYGHKSVESRAPIERDTIYRIYSMTKPVTAAAAMALIEDGALSLDAPVARYIPAFERLTVNRCGAGDRLDARPAERAMTILHLLTHTSGLTYGEGNPGAVARLYERQRTDFGPNDGPLADVVDRLAGIPLLFEPGAAWNYGVSSDVLGRVIEIASGRPLDVFIEERILTPLRMTDTGFRVPDAKLNRLASLYQATPNDRFTLLSRPSTRRRRSQ